MMYGRLKHIARATGRPFASDWALVMKFDEAGKLALYHFYEDTAALEWALGVNE
jgi:ketosteroid isomerase-like protein